jgi:integrase/recombinase XerD
LKIEEFLEARAFALNTKKAYQRELLRFMEWVDKPWAEVTSRQVTRYKTHLKEQNLRPTSLNRALSAVMSFYDWLGRSEGLADPTRAVDLEKLPEPLPQFLSDEQVDTVFQALDTPRDLALLAVLSRRGANMAMTSSCGT